MSVHFLTALVMTCCTASAVAQATQEFIVITVHGDVRTWILPTDWEPRFEKGHLLFTGQNRLRTEQVAAVRPKRSDTLAGYHEVAIHFTAITGKRITQLFWVPDVYRTLEDAPQENGFLLIDAQTILRPGSYSVE